MVSLTKILNSLSFVVKNSSFVSISDQAIKLYCDNFQPVQLKHWSEIYPLTYKPKAIPEEELDFLFLIGSQAFFFWGYPNKWTIQYKNQSLDGWWALVASFDRAIERKLPILDGKFLANLSLKEVAHIFEGTPEIPLLKERQKILNNIGQVLVSKYNGRFYNFFKQKKRDAVSLISTLSSEFYGFDDIVEYKDSKIYFFKKAQLVVADIHSVFNGKGYGSISGVEKLPGHADYKIPMILRKLGILVYNQELSDFVDNRVEIKQGSEMEVEIRVNMLWATHLICKKLKVKYPKISSTILSGVLWNQSQKKDKNDKPYHLTKTIYY